MPPVNLSNDPEGDYVSNEVLHDMISKAMQAPGVVLVGPDASDEEEEAEAEGDDEEEGNESAEEEQDEEEVEDKQEGE